MDVLTSCGTHDSSNVLLKYDEILKFYIRKELQHNLVINVNDNHDNAHNDYYHNDNDYCHDDNDDDKCSKSNGKNEPYEAQSKKLVQ